MIKAWMNNIMEYQFSLNSEVVNTPWLHLKANSHEHSLFFLFIVI